MFINLNITLKIYDVWFKPLGNEAGNVSFWLKWLNHLQKDQIELPECLEKRLRLVKQRLQQLELTIQENLLQRIYGTLQPHKDGFGSPVLARNVGFFTKHEVFSVIRVRLHWYLNIHLHLSSLVQMNHRYEYAIITCLRYTILLLSTRVQQNKYFLQRCVCSCGHLC